MLGPRLRAPLPAPLPAPRRVTARPRRLPCGGRLDLPTPPCQARRCRRRFRTTTTGRTRTPSVGSTRALRSGQARSRTLFMRVDLASHPLARFEPGHAPSRAGGSPRTIPRSCGRLAVAGSGVTSPRERCVSPTSATDSRHEHPAVRSIPGGTPARAAPCGVSRPRAPTHPGREPRWRGVGTLPSACRMSHPGGASLDGEPPASACAATIA